MSTLSFRDPLSKVFKEGDVVYRKLNNDSYSFFKTLKEKFFFQEMIAKKKVQSFELDHKDLGTMTHKYIKNFIPTNEMSSYQLYLSGLHTLDLLVECLKKGYSLKDASSWNVVFYDGQPLFLDVGSFESWDGNKVWIAYGQFVRHFIVPLIINKETGIKTSFIFNNYFDGIDPFTAKKILGIKSFKSWKNLEFIYLPSLLERKKITKVYDQTKNKDDKEINLSILLRIINRLRSKLESLEPKNESFWSEYTFTRDHYSNIDIEIKKNFFKNFILSKSGNLLDIGCNTGEFLNLATQNKNIKSFGIDFDEECINFTQKKYIESNINLSCINIANPPNGIGWINSETKAFIKKNELFYDIVLFFGIMHHLLVTNRIPLNEILKLLNNLTKNYIVYEFVNKEDKKFLELAGRNIYLYKYFNEEFFENEITKYFTIEDKINYKDNKNRIIYILKKNTDIVSK